MNCILNLRSSPPSHEAATTLIFFTFYSTPSFPMPVALSRAFRTMEGLSVPTQSVCFRSCHQCLTQATSGDDKQQAHTALKSLIWKKHVSLLLLLSHSKSPAAGRPSSVMGILLLKEEERTQAGGKLSSVLQTEETALQRHQAEKACLNILFYND